MSLRYCTYAHNDGGLVPIILEEIVAATETMVKEGPDFSML